MNSGKLFIAVAGNIGTGKTTVTQMLSKRFNWKAEFESVNDNPYLEDFYKNMARWSFPLQVCFLTRRFQTHQIIFQGLHSSVQDRCIYEDASIFTRNLYEQGQMEERDYRNYLDLYENLCQFLTPPDLIIYLRKSVPNLKKQILLRGRTYEKNISDHYLSGLNRYYDEWIESYDLGKKLVIESDSLNFLEDPVAFQFLTQQIIEALD